MDSNKRQAIGELRAAKSELQKNGWCKNRFEDDAGSRCIVGALQSIGSRAASASGRLARIELSKHLPGSDAHPYRTTILGIMTYNDDPNTSFGDVMTLFDKALADLGALHE